MRLRGRCFPAEHASLVVAGCGGDKHNDDQASGAKGGKLREGGAGREDAPWAIAGVRDEDESGEESDGNETERPRQW